MKSRIVLSLFFLISCVADLRSSDFDQKPIGTPLKIKNILILTRTAIFLGEDDTIWKIKKPPFETNRSWSEWWHSKTPKQPNVKYYFELQNWPSAPTVQLLDYVWDSIIAKELFKEDKEVQDLLNYSQMMQEIVTGQTVFAELIDVDQLATLLMIFAEEEFARGYFMGFSDGDVIIINNND